jgi:hypothetical protein
MKVFISWSGQLSMKLADILKHWLPSVIQAVKPYYTPDDIAKGTRWSTEIAKELEEAKIGIICLTRENLEAPWIMFEAGALSKNVGTSKVCPILFGVDATDTKGPLVQFQSAKFEKNDIKKVIDMINTELGDGGLTADVLDKVFEKWWPELKEKVESTLKSTEGVIKHTIRSEREILEEILQLTRTIAQNPVRDTLSELLTKNLDPSESHYRNALYRAFLNNLMLGTKKEDKPKESPKEERKIEIKSES